VYKNTLNQLEAIISDIDSYEQNFSGIREQLVNECDSITGSFGFFDNTLRDLKTLVDANIAICSKYYYSKTSEIYSQDAENNRGKPLVREEPSLSEDVESYLRARLAKYSDWHFPGAILRPGTGRWIENLVALDPLYIIDTDHDLVRQSLDGFNEQYQNRLRFYTLQEDIYAEVRSDRQSTTGFSPKLPLNQFWVVFAYNFLNYKPLHIIIQYLRWVHSLLRPGGSFVFTFNDCDKWAGVDLAERNFAAYTPGKVVFENCQEIGFTITNCYDINGASAWVELAKPGPVETRRGGQSLAKIVDKPHNT
jgi:SAM-dependent methyltransferase